MPQVMIASALCISADEGWGRGDDDGDYDRDIEGHIKGCFCMFMLDIASWLVIQLNKQPILRKTELIVILEAKEFYCAPKDS